MLFRSNVNVTTQDIYGNNSFDQSSSQIVVNSTAAPAPSVINLTLSKTAVNSSVQNGSIATFVLNVTNVGEVNLIFYSLGDNFNITYLNYSASDIAPSEIN